MNMQYTEWPVDVPLPTDEEFKEAEKRYRLEIDLNDARLKLEGKFDSSDYRCGLPFVMATYNIIVWWTLFYPSSNRFNFENRMLYVRSMNG